MDFGFDLAANFEHSTWNPPITEPLDDLAQRLGRTLDEARRSLETARAKLFAARNERARPGCDDKVLTSWNALMVKGLAHAGRVMQRPEWIAAAFGTADFLRQTVWCNGRLLASYKNGEARLNGYLDDYAFLLDALLELMQADCRPSDLDWAKALAEALLAQFEDTCDGGFFFTSHDHETLIHRPKPGYDQATPAGNGVAAFALQRLGLLLNDSRFITAAERCLAHFYPAIAQQPVAYPGLLEVLDEALHPPRRIVLRGPKSGLDAWISALAPNLTTRDLLLALPNGLALPDALNKPESDTVTAWVCSGQTCQPPVTECALLIR